MASYTILKNQPIVINLPSDYSEQGWSISGGKAAHNGCNAGYIRNAALGLVLGQSYQLSYTVSGYASGQVYALMGNTAGAARTANGVYTETLTVTATTDLRFYSDGNLTVELVSLVNTADLGDNAVTLAFNPDKNRWTTYYSYTPEMLCRFIDGFFAFRDGQLWEQNSEDAPRNNFFGEQFPSKLTFYVNINPSEFKQYFSLHVASNKVWAAPENGDIKVLPTQGKPAGQSSRLKKGNFRQLQGEWWADFLRDLNDPRFAGNELAALMKGAELQGQVLEITLSNTDTEEVRLVSVDVKTAPHNYTY